MSKRAQVEFTKIFGICIRTRTKQVGNYISSEHFQLDREHKQCG